MKKQIRLNVFETNSSSTHTLQILNKSDYSKLSNGYYLFDGYDFSWENKKDAPVKNNVYSKEEVISYIKTNKYSPDIDWDNFDNLDEDESISDDYETIKDLFREFDFYDLDYYFEDEYLESFEESFTTPSGDQIIVFGKYGHD